MTDKNLFVIQHRVSQAAPDSTLYFGPPGTCNAEGVSFFSLAYHNDKKRVTKKRGI